MQATQVVEFERQLAGVACTARAWAKVPAAPSAEQRSELKARVKRLLMERSAVLLAHYYVEPDIQDLAEETGGCVADSLEMARFGRAHAAPTLVVRSPQAQQSSRAYRSTSVAVNGEMPP